MNFTYKPYFYLPKKVASKNYTVNGRPLVATVIPFLLKIFLQSHSKDMNMLFQQSRFHILFAVFCLVHLKVASAAANNYFLDEDKLTQQILGTDDGNPYLSPDEETIKKKAPPSAETLAETAGYYLESYQTTTVDGYQLVIHRLLKKGSNRKNNGNKPVVLLQHGIAQSSADWLINDSGKSMAMMLVDSGYDVFLGNCRGNKYSNTHASLESNTMEYYNFTFHEMGIHDFPATVNLILRETKKRQINFIGSSLGATMFFVGLSAFPGYASRIRFMGAISPQVFLTHTKTPIKILAPHLQEIKEAAVRLGVMRINPETLPVMINQQLGKLCFWRKLSRALCNSIYKMLDEFDLRKIEEKHLDDLWKYIPTTTSAKTCMHLLQLMNNQDGVFDEYDFGLEGNTKMYDGPDPPEYLLSHARVPVAIFTGMEELFSTWEDTNALKRALPYVVEHVEVDATFRVHTDFTHEAKAVESVFKPMISILNRYNPPSRKETY